MIPFLILEHVVPLPHHLKSTSSFIIPIARSKVETPLVYSLLYLISRKNNCNVICYLSYLIVFIIEILPNKISILMGF